MTCFWQQQQFRSDEIRISFTTSSFEMHENLEVAKFHAMIFLCWICFDFDVLLTRWGTSRSCTRNLNKSTRTAAERSTTTSTFRCHLFSAQYNSKKLFRAGVCFFADFRDCWAVHVFTLQCAASAWGYRIPRWWKRTTIPWWGACSTCSTQTKAGTRIRTAMAPQAD